MNTNLKNWLIVVPARLNSQRLAKKPLQDLTGKPLIVRVYSNLIKLKSLGAEVLVATDSQEVIDVCQKYEVQAVLTASHHKSGTDRCLEAASNINRPFVMNVQGDEPLLKADDLVDLAMSLEANPDADMATLVYRSSDSEDYKNPNVVKAVTDDDGYALYFSRSPIPHLRNNANHQFTFLQHIGVYAFKSKSLKIFCSLNPSSLEQTEGLEQLRALQAGMKIFVKESKNKSIGIDTEEDLLKARQLF